MKYTVNMRVRLEQTVIEEVYEVEASSPIEAEEKVLEGGGDLKEDAVIDYGNTVKETVISVTTEEEW